MTRKVRGSEMSQNWKKRNSLPLFPATAAALGLLMPAVAAAMDRRVTGRRVDSAKKKTETRAMRIGPLAKPNSEQTIGWANQWAGLAIRHL